MVNETILAVIIAFVISAILCPIVIPFLHKLKFGQQVRDDGPQAHLKKQGTPTMGGLVILSSIIITSLLYLKDYPKIIPVLFVTAGFGVIGFLDDYIKVFRKNKEGLNGRFKIIGQVGLGIIVGLVMWLSPQVVVKQKLDRHAPKAQVEYVNNNGARSAVYMAPAEKSVKTTIPFVKNNEFNYHWLVPGDSERADLWTWLVYVVIATLVITAVSNGANLTDGLDGLASGVSATIVVILGILAWLSGNVIYADYLNIMYIPSSGELIVFAAAFAGALFGFLWYNCYPAQVFMGDTGSLAIGGIIAVFALLIRKELLLPLLCGIFLVEALSVLIQRGWFKYTKRKYGEGRRVFLMAPIHHHYQKKGYFESKIVVRFWIVQLLLAAITLATLKIR